jgi:GDP-L-fucose synthase
MFDKIFISGHKGMLGSAIHKKVAEKKLANKILVATREEVDLTDQKQTFNFLSDTKPSHVVIAAAKVGGIHASITYPGDFIYDNVIIATNLLKGSLEAGVKNVLFIGSSCIYPRDTPQPMAESALLSGYPEPTNEPYALAKIVGIKMCESFNRQYGVDYRSVQPSNLYGPGDRYHLEDSHVIPALIQRFHEASLNGSKSLKVWGSGNVKREFLYSEDIAEGCLHIMSLSKKEFNSSINPRCSHVNLGAGVDYSIRDVAELIASITGFKGDIVFDKSKPDGHPRKLLDISLAESLGWRSRIDLKEGLELAYHYYITKELKQ